MFECEDVFSKYLESFPVVVPKTVVVGPEVNHFEANSSVQ